MSDTPADAVRGILGSPAPVPGANLRPNVDDLRPGLLAEVTRLRIAVAEKDTEIAELRRAIAGVAVILRTMGDR